MNPVFADSTNNTVPQDVPGPQTKPKPSRQHIEAQKAKNIEMKEVFCEKRMLLTKMIEDLAEQYSKYIAYYFNCRQTHLTNRPVNFVAKQLLLGKIGDETRKPSVWQALLHHEAKKRRLEGVCSILFLCCF